MPKLPDANEQVRKSHGWRPSLAAAVALALFGPVLAYSLTTGLLGSSASYERSSASYEPQPPEEMMMPLPHYKVEAAWPYLSPDGAYVATQVDGDGAWVALHEKGAPAATAEPVAYTSWQTGAFSGIDSIKWIGPRTLQITAWNEMATRTSWRGVQIEVKVRQDAAELMP